jgi:hypothetical protein
MKKKIYFKFRKIFFFNTLIFIFSLSYFGLTSPVSLQKILTLRPLSDDIKIYDDSFAALSDNELSNFIGSIPFSENENLPFLSRGNFDNSWNVKPSIRYEDSIIRGNGNCSNLVFGAMYEFNNLKKQASVWHLIPNDLSFLKGFGHTVLQINVNGEDTIVDILEGGTPLQNEKKISALNFKINPSDIFSQNTFSIFRDNKNKYFTNENLVKMRFGVTPQNEIRKYFLFIDKIYFPLSSKYLEKFIFDSLSLFFGKYPKTYVSNDFFYNSLKKAKFKTIIAYLTFLSFHFFYLGLFIYIIKRIINFIN